MDDVRQLTRLGFANSADPRLRRPGEVVQAIPAGLPRVWAIPAAAPYNGLRVQGILVVARDPFLAAAEPDDSMTPLLAGAHLALVFVQSFLLGFPLWALLRALLF